MNKEKVMAAIKTILDETVPKELREDRNFKDTPRRVMESYEELLEGYEQDPIKILQSATYEETPNDVVIVKDTYYYSLCSHHLVPFFGKAHVAYIPSNRVVGLSKIPRVIRAVTRKHQLQERIANEIADAVHKAIEPKGVAVIIEGQHLCYESRGVNSRGSNTITVSTRGVSGADARAYLFTSLMSNGSK